MRMTLSMPCCASRLYASCPLSVMASRSASISMRSICRVHASRIGYSSSQSQPMSVSSIGRSGSRDLFGQHQLVPQRTSFESDTGGLAVGASLARLRAGVSL